ncbi:energy transducer TonB [Hyunsoonleella sp. SJ7]|uniref:Energy transducer TonB n=1 Tax=Hyunsoonleella aquatilis TaxID=2762758 RepID=A0A923KHL4_9FLAO|nr:energy transducer TonB [Hyunsoonleella aquatilis]MBC3756894.1 energy transducer TonB [Hyunsoonleella aquatilis]
MSNSKNTHDSVRQNGLVKKPQKHDANLQKNSTLYFQVGLIVCLLAAFGLLEMRFQTIIPDDYGPTLLPDEDLYVFNDVVKIYEEKAEIIEKRTKPTNFNNPIIKEDDDILAEETPEIFTEPEITSDPISPDEVMPTAPEPVEAVVDFIRVEEVPIYPGCEKEDGNEAKRKCMSDKITKLVKRKFNGGRIATQFGLQGKQRISVQFQVDKTGRVTDIKTRGPLPALEQEAERVVNIIPKMEPGKQRSKPVGVRYTLPIIFIAE